MHQLLFIFLNFPCVYIKSVHFISLQSWMQHKPISGTVFYLNVNWAIQQLRPNATSAKQVRDCLTTFAPRTRVSRSVPSLVAIPVGFKCTTSAGRSGPEANQPQHGRCTRRLSHDCALVKMECWIPNVQYSRDNSSTNVLRFATSSSLSIDVSIGWTMLSPAMRSGWST
jgi:hypothetical protein